MHNAGTEGQIAFFGGREAMETFLRRLAASSAEQQAVFGPDGATRLREWAVLRADEGQKLAVFGSAEAARRASEAFWRAPGERLDLAGSFARNAAAALQAIVPLTVLFFLVLWLVLREKAARMDELLLGIAFAVIGMTIFSMGIELGLSRLGSQIGDKLPAAFKSIELNDQRQVIRNFDPTRVQTATAPDGRLQQFFHLHEGGRFVALPYDESRFDPATRTYTFTPQKGPLYGEAGSIAGIVVVLS